MIKLEQPGLKQLHDYIRSDMYRGWSRLSFGIWEKEHICPMKRFFTGTCHYSSEALVDMFFPRRARVVRGWYTRTEELAHESDWIRNDEGHIAHSWVEYEDKIIDPTWWAFHPAVPAAIYAHSINNSHYHTKDPR